MHITLNGSLFALLILAPATALADNPIANFVEVESGIYRGGSPGEAGVLYLKNLGVKTILDLDNDTVAMKTENAAAQSDGVRWISLPMSGFWAPHTATVDAALAVMENPSMRPLFVHCKHGQDRTGLLVGLFRTESERWQPGHAYEEMKALGFHPALFFLNHYFEKRTGFED